MTKIIKSCGNCRALANVSVNGGGDHRWLFVMVIVKIKDLFICFFSLLSCSSSRFWLLSSCRRVHSSSEQICESHDLAVGSLQCIYIRNSMGEFLFLKGYTKLNSDFISFLEEYTSWMGINKYITLPNWYLFTWYSSY